MSTAFLQFEPQQALKGLRNHAARVRALLDVLDRVVPPPGGGPGVQGWAAAQLVEEVSGLGTRLLECAAAMAGGSVTSDWVAVSPMVRPGE
jgi:hypothetical protein